MKKYNAMHRQRKLTAVQKEAARYKDGLGKQRKLQRDAAKGRS